MSFYNRQQITKIQHEKCPACDAMHQVVRPFREIPVLICPLIRDLIYLYGIAATKESRQIIRESLLGC